MLAWAMNMGFAASPAGAPVQPKKPFVVGLGLSLLRLGGTVFSAIPFLGLIHGRH